MTLTWDIYFCHLQTHTSSMVPVAPFPAPLSSCPTIEVEQFTLEQPELAAPFTTYVNHLYVSTGNLKYDCQKVFAKVSALTPSQYNQVISVQSGHLSTIRSSQYNQLISVQSGHLSGHLNFQYYKLQADNFACFMRISDVQCSEDIVIGENCHKINFMESTK